MISNKFTRRGFLAQAGAGSLASLNEPAQRAVEYQGTADSLQVFWRAAGGRRLIQEVASANPSYVTLNPSGDRLFAVNEIAEFQGLPCGSVESYAVTRDSGRLQFISRQRLALSATYPRHLAVSPDGRWMVVAVYGGGAYNVLPIEADGTIGAVTQAFKEIGDGRMAHPRTVFFHPSGRSVLANDVGCGRVSVFVFENGTLTRIQRVDAAIDGGLTDGSELFRHFAD